MWAADNVWLRSSLLTITYELWQRGNDPVVCQEQVVLRAQVALGLVRLKLAAQLGQANHLGHLC